MKRKILFFDIDGTLIGKSMTLQPKNMEAIQVARENGYLLFICTGRALTSVYPSIRELGFDGYITSAGSIIYINNQSVFEHYISADLLNKTLLLFGAQGIPFTLETKHALYQTSGVRSFFEKRDAKIANSNQELKRMKETKRNRAHVLNFDTYDFSIPVSKITFVSTDKTRFEEIRGDLSNDFNIVLFSNENDAFCNGELIDKNCTKGDALKYVCDYYDIPLSESIAFGDSMNDYEMISTAGVSVVAKSAPEALLEMADYTFDDPDNDGIYNVMKQIDLI